MRAERGTAWLRAVVQPGLNGALPGRAQLCSTVCLRFCQPFLLQPELSFLILNSASLVTKLFSSMGINRPIDKLIVQKVFEMIKAGKSHSQIGDFFHHTRQWVQHLLTNYSPTSCSPVSVRNRGPRRKTTREEDQLIIQKADQKEYALPKMFNFNGGWKYYVAK